MLEQKLELFIERMKFDKSASPQTIKAYRHDINNFIYYLKDRLVTPLEISEWLEFLNKKKYSPRTIARALSALRSFYNFLVKNNYEQDNFFDLFCMPKTNQYIPVVLSTKQMKIMLEQLPEHNHLDRRNKCILMLLYMTGMRSEELCTLELSGIFSSQKIIKVIGKGNKQRLIPLIPKAQKILHAWMSEREFFDKHGSNFVFLSKNGHPLTTAMIRKIIDKVVVNSSEISKMHPHAFRYSCASHLLDNGADLRHIQEFLGHSNISVTQRYTKLSLGSVKEKFHQFHPRG